MDLAKFLNSLFSGVHSVAGMGAELHRRHTQLKEAFDRFGNGLVGCKDPQFFAQAVSTDLDALSKGLVKLTVFGSDEVLLCFHAIQDKGEYQGQVRCFLRKGYEIGTLGSDARQIPVCRWTFDWRGNTNVKLSGGDVLSMNEPPDAVALSVGVLLAVYSNEIEAYEEAQSK